MITVKPEDLDEEVSAPSSLIVSPDEVQPYEQPNITTKTIEKPANVKFDVLDEASKVLQSGQESVDILKDPTKLKTILSPSASPSTLPIQVIQKIFSEAISRGLGGLHGLTSADVPVTKESGDLDIGKTAGASALKGILHPEQVPLPGEQFQKAYPNLHWAMSGTLGSALDILPLLLGGKKATKDLAIFDELTGKGSDTSKMTSSQFKEFGARQNKEFRDLAKKDPEAFKQRLQEEIQKRMTPEQIQKADEYAKQFNGKTEAEILKTQEPIVVKPEEVTLAPVQDFKISEAIDQPKTALFGRGESQFKQLKQESQPLIEKVNELEAQLDSTEVLSERAKITDEIRGTQSQISQSEQNLQTRLNDESEATIQLIMDYAGSSGIRWPRVRQKDFRQKLMESMADETTPQETTPRMIADELIKYYHQIDTQRAAAPKKPKTVIGYIRASGGISNQSIIEAGYTLQDFVENGARQLLGGKQKFDQMANELIEEGIVQHVEGESPTETVLNAIKERKKMLAYQDKSAEDEIAKNEREIAEEQKAYGEAKQAGTLYEGASAEPSVEEITAIEAEGKKEADTGVDERIKEEAVQQYSESAKKRIEQFKAETQAKFPTKPISPTDKNLIQEKKRPGELFRVSDESRIVPAAIKEFGLTDDFSESGYMLTDGRLLDFSQKKEGGTPGGRPLDHRSINYVLPKDKKHDARFGGQSLGMYEFMRMGNIRMKPEAGGFEIAIYPTPEQNKALARYINELDGKVIVDITDPNGGPFKSQEFQEGTRAWEVIDYIQKELSDPKYRVSDIGFFMTRRGEMIEERSAIKTIEEGRKLIQSLVPHVDFKPVGQILTQAGKEALGVFIQVGEGVMVQPAGLIKTVMRAGIRVYEHEISHAALNLYATREERTEILQEAKDLWGAQDDIEADEKIARGFEEYRQKTREGKSADSILGKKLSERMRQFFKNIMEAIRRWVIAARNKEQFSKIKKFYDSLSAGEYARRGPARIVKPAVERYRVPEENNPILEPKSQAEAIQIKPLQTELSATVKKIDALKKIGQRSAELESKRDRLINQLNQFLAPHNAFEVSQELKKHIGQLDFFDSELPPGGKPVMGDIEPRRLRDLSGVEAAMRDVYRNFKDVFGDQYEKIKKEILDPLDASRGRFVDMQYAWVNELQNTVVKKLGVKPGSKESAAVQDYGEGNRDYDSLVKSFGKQKADKLVEADAWFRTAYDDLLGRVNSSIAKIYPGQEEKLVHKRQSYYRHFREFSSLSGLMNIFDTPANIASKLAGISEVTKPKSKWLSFAQQRLGIQTDIDAVKGFLDYLPAAAYATHISPNIPRFRTLAKELRAATATNPDDQMRIEHLYESRRLSRDPLEKEKIQGMIDDLSQRNYLNTFIAFLDDFAGDLAGKTNPYFDRVLQKVIGRKPMAVINWLNRRIKANVILGNASSAISQVFNIPQAVGRTKLYSVLGMGDSIVQVWKASPEMEKSIFLKTRYADSMYDKFDRGMVKDTMKFARWMMIVGDEIASRFIWNSAYEMGKGRKVADPIKFADNLTREMVAGRSVGEVPLMQKGKFFQLIAPFQVEVQNLLWAIGDMAKDRDISGLIVLMIMAYLFNEVSEKAKGHRVMFDPIHAAIEASKEDLTVEQRLGRVIGEVLSNVPLGGYIQAIYPEYGKTFGSYQLPTRKQFFGDTDTTRFGKGVFAEGLADPIYKVLPPFGGNQLKKTIEGNMALNEGFVKFGKKPIFVSDNLFNRITATLFGKYALPEVKEYLKERAEREQWNYIRQRG